MEIEEIWKQFGQQLRNFIQVRVPEAHIADELTQELLIKAYNNLSSLQDYDRLDAWLYRIARNVINDYYRKKSTDKENLMAEMDEIVVSIEDDSQQNHIREELSQCVKPFIYELPSKYRQIIIAVDLEGYSQKALADKLGVNYSTIKSQTQRGRSQLKKLFNKCCDFDIDARGNIMGYKPRSKQCKCNPNCSEL